MFIATGFECSSVTAQEVLKRTHKVYCFLIASILYIYIEATKMLQQELYNFDIPLFILLIWPQKSA
jgi:hypothetical protein